MRHVLLATTGSDDCRRAEEFAVSYCAREAMPLRIIHAVDSSLEHYGQVDTLATEGDRHSFIGHARHQESFDATERLQRVMAHARAFNVDYELYIEWDAPLYCIVKQARRDGSELLVIGGKRKRFNPFSLSRSLMRKAPCAVKQIHE